MLAQIDVRQFNEWRAYADLEPFDQRRGDWRSAQIVQAIENAFRKRGRPPVQLKDCLLEFVDRDKDADEARDNPELARKRIMAAMKLLVKMHEKPPKKARSSGPRPPNRLLRDAPAGRGKERR